MNNKISEKSLEINISENMLRELRNLSPEFHKLFIYGFTIKEESRTGLDISIRLDQNRNFLSAFQYKKPISKSESSYRFYINNNSTRDQHVKLLIASDRAPNRVFYVFPAIIDTCELYEASPDFLEYCYFVKPEDIRIFDNHVHIVDINVRTGRASVFSKERQQVNTYRWEDVKGFLKKEKMITIKTLRAEFKKFTFEMIMNKYQIKENIIKNPKLRLSTGFFA